MLNLINDFTIAFIENLTSDIKRNLAVYAMHLSYQNNIFQIMSD